MTWKWGYYPTRGCLATFASMFMHVQNTTHCIYTPMCVYVYEACNINSFLLAEKNLSLLNAFKPQQLFVSIFSWVIIYLYLSLSCRVWHPPLFLLCSLRSWVTFYYLNKRNSEPNLNTGNPLEKNIKNTVNSPGNEHPSVSDNPAPCCGRRWEY